MTITIELEADAVAVAQARARAQGLDVHEFLSRYVDQYLRSLPEQVNAARPEQLSPFSQEQVERDWDEFSAGTEHLPLLAEADLSREAMYADHD